MKKIIPLGCIIVFIVMLFRTASVIQSIGFIIGMGIIFFIACCIAGAGYLGWRGSDAVANHDIIYAVISFIEAGIVLVVGIKVTLWLIGVLM